MVFPNFTDKKLKLLPFLLLGAVPPPFHLLDFYNGSAERWWIYLLYLGWIPWLPLYLLLFPTEITVNPGISPLNIYIVIPIITMFATTFFKKSINKYLIALNLKFLRSQALNIIVLSSIIITNLISYIKTCNETTDCTKKNMRSFLKIIYQSIIEIIICKVLIFIIYFITYIPFPPIKIALIIVSLIPYSIMFSIIFPMIHIFINLYNNKDICNYCTKPI